MKLVLGILGGMGTYATIHLFEQYAEVFPAVKEWDRPRIIIDNRCTMPSRVRAFLYNENTDQLVCEMADSMRSLVNAGCNRIILACNTSHLFLPEIYEIVPELENKVVNIITNTVDLISKDSIKQVYLLGSEGTIDSQIYQQSLNTYKVDCLCPNKAEYPLIRECIEAVKQNVYSDKIRDIFVSLVNQHDSCILGCTELPILYEKYKKDIICNRIYDPIKIALLNSKEEFNNG